VRKAVLLLLALLSPAVLTAQVTFTESVFHSFTTADGAQPQNLILAQDGNFYGIAGGGTRGDGVIFSVSPSGVGSTLYNFTGEPAASVSGGSSLVQASDGNFYGVTALGGKYNIGCIFKVTTAGEYTTLYSFAGESDGYTPTAILQGSDGNFYGTARTGQQATYGSNFGTIFKITPAGDFTLLVDLVYADGFDPASPLIEGGAMTFYGTASGGGGANEGTVYSINGSDVNVLYSFSNDDTDAKVPVAGLVEGPSQEFYGGATAGGVHGDSALFSVSASGGYTYLSTLPYDPNGSAGITSSLLLATDGNLYGNINAQNGTLFQASLTGTLNLLYTFAGGADGEDPNGAIIQGADGNLYGVTTNGGSQSRGTIYKITPSTAFAPPIQLTLSSTSIALGESVTLSYAIREAYSVTSQQCFAFVQNAAAAAGQWNGAQNALITPTAPGTYTYALTCGGTESGFATLTVAGKSSTTALSQSPTPISAGQTLTLKATVSGTGGTPSGSVTFYDGTLALVSEPLAAGVATFVVPTYALPAGSYPITARYSGDTNFGASTSPVATVVLNKAATATSLAALPNPVTPPANVTFTATVKRTATGAAGSPTGSVGFYFGSNLLSTASLNASGVASYTVSTSGLPAGSYAVTAKYSGDSGDADSNSSAATVVIK
jgi:uncharacterized repeat protein (TIGR03803 family)